jgi:hypothetical protein
MKFSKDDVQEAHAAEVHFELPQLSFFTSISKTYIWNQHNRRALVTKPMGLQGNFNR